MNKNDLVNKNNIHLFKSVIKWKRNWFGGKPKDKNGNYNVLTQYTDKSYGYGDLFETEGIYRIVRYAHLEESLIKEKLKVYDFNLDYKLVVKLTNKFNTRKELMEYILNNQELKYKYLKVYK